MTAAEQRALLRTAAVLAAASLLRVGLELGRGPPAVPPGAEDALPGLLAAVDSATREEQRRSEPLAEGETVDPNRAGEVELDRLPGIGEVTARAVVESREREGPFVSADDLTRVRGIGPATVEKIRPLLDLSRGAPVGRRGTVGGRRPERGAGGAGGAEPGGTRLAGGGARAGPVAGGGAPAAPVDLNRATSTELQTLPGIGPALAERILARRRARPFRTVEELLEVKGIGPATLERIRARVSAR